MSSRLRILVWMAAIGVPLCGQADQIKLVRGGPITAKVWEQSGDELTYNVFRTAIRIVTHGTEKISAKQVKQVVDDPDPHRSYWRKADALQPGTADEWTKLGDEAAKAKLRGLAKHAYTEALVRDPKQDGARKALGADLARILASDRRLNAALDAKLKDYVAITEFPAREVAAAEIAKLGGTMPFHALERAWRSAKEKKGRTEDRLLTFQSKEHKGVYTVYVPESYDPFTPTPLVVGLHGGGRGGKDGKAVVGSGPSAMNFYESGAGRRGWIVVCPTAIEAPWSAKPNDGFLLAVIEEACILFNIDRNRIYLTGHSMGGFGTWHYGPLYCHLWAAIAPMAGGGGGNLPRLQETQTGVYIYHGADDPVVGVASDRAVADLMLKGAMDFAYAEIPNSGHGFPPEVEKEMFEFFAVRRLAVTPDRSPKGQFVVTESLLSSFEAKPSKDEVAYFGPIGKPPIADDKANDVGALIADLRKGGGLAEKAAAKLGAVKDPAAAAKVAAILADATAPADTRRFAAEALGAMGQPASVKPLLVALGDPDLDILGAAALSLGRIPSPETPKALVKCAKALKERFDRKMVGTKIEYPDFEAHLLAASKVVTAAGVLKDRASSPAVDQIAKDLLLPKYDVDASQRAGQDPNQPRRRLARSLVDALTALADPTSKPTLQALAARPDLGVDEDAKKLL